MVSYIWPMALVILANIIYQICAKSVPKAMNPFATLTVTYLIGAVVSGILYFSLTQGADLWKEYGRLNWAPVALGLAVVGLETGWIYAYKAGWPVSTGFLTQSAFLAVVLLCLGYFLFHETISWSKILGAIICMIGLVFLNR